MSYRYRWFYIVFVIAFVLICIYQFDVKVLIRQRDVLIAKAHDLDREIQQRKKIMSEPRQAKIPNITENNYVGEMPDFLNILHESDLEIIGINNVAGLSDLPGYSMYQLSLRGEYPNYLNFLRELDEKDAAYRIKDFSFSLDERHQIRASFSIVYAASNDLNAHQKIVELSEEFNPFCGADNRLSDIKKLSKLFSIHDMQLLGTVMRNGRYSAIIRLPNGTVLNMNHDDLLGSEGGRVIKVAARAVTLQLPDLSQKILGRNRSSTMTDAKE